MGNRAIFSDLAFDRVSGKTIPGATVSIRIPGTVDLIPETIYANDDDVDSTTKPNPFVSAADGRIQFYLTLPRKVDIYVTKPGYTPSLIPGLVLALTTSTLIVQDEGVNLAQRNALDFIGDSVVASDDAPGARTKVTVNHLDSAVHAAAQPAQAHTHSHDTELTGVSANDHHNQAHSIIGADHTGFPGGTTTFLRADGTFASATGAHTHSHDTELTGVSADDHHAQLHAAAHAVGQPDVVTPAAIGAADASHTHGGGSDVPAGVSVDFRGTVAPTGWLLEDGASYLRTDFSNLFGVIGTLYGAADGTHFNVPDSRGRFSLGKATAGTGSVLGATGGAIDHAHTNPATGAGSAHAHTISGSSAAGAAHSHGNGSYTQPSHQHTQDATGSDSHSHSSGTYVAASHTHGSAGSHNHGGAGVPFGSGSVVDNNANAGTHTHTSTAPDVSGTSASDTHSHTNPNVHSAGDDAISGTSATEAAHTHAVGTLAAANESAHTHSQADTGTTNPPYLVCLKIIKT